MSKHTEKQVVELTLKKMGIKYHHMINTDNSEYSIIQPMNPSDTNGHIWVEGHGLIPLKHSDQLCGNFFEFHKDKLASY